MQNVHEIDGVSWYTDSRTLQKPMSLKATAEDFRHAYRYAAGSGCPVIAAMAKKRTEQMLLHESRGNISCWNAYRIQK